MAINNLWQELILATETLSLIAADFKTAMLCGLNRRPSPLKMLPSYLGKPSGQEKGLYIALDFGGTNLRVLLVELQGNGCFKVRTWHQTRLKDPSAGYDYTSADTNAEELFHFIAGEIAQVAPSHKAILLGHTFSFPSHQTSLNNASLITWTKEISTAGMEGMNISELLTAALNSRGLRNIYPVAVINDTVGTLLAAAYSNSATAIGSICGTGHNTAYFEPSSRMIINMESGNFNHLPNTIYDTALDNASEKPGQQLLEKMTAGHYLGELLRLIVTDSIKLPPASRWFIPYAVTAQDISWLISGSPSSLTADLSPADHRMICQIAQFLRTRSAQLVAATYWSILSHIDPEGKLYNHIAIDGSLYEKMPGYAEDITTTLNVLSRRTTDRLSVGLTKDGSGIGAAIAAAIAKKN